MGGDEAGNKDETHSSALPPHTTCAKCDREITCETQDRYRHRWIEVRDIFTDSARYYHHACYNQTH